MLNRLRRDRAGNFAMLTALLMLPLMAASGLAVDYANLSRLRSNLQNANDAAALMAAEYYDRHGSLPSEEDVQKTLEANLHEAASIGDFSVKGNSVLLASTADARLIFGGVLPKRTSEVGVLSAVKVHNDEQLDVVLVLDNTGSMAAEGKIDALKSAAKDFIHTLLALNTKGRENVRIGIVPFSNYVNVGMENRYASWMWVPQDQSGTNSTPAGSYKQCNGWTTDYNNCHTSTSYNDGVATGTYKSCSRSCTGGYSTVYYPAGKHAWSTTWRGCVGSRGPYPYNVKDEYGSRPFIGLPQIQGTYIAGFPSVSCPTALTPLTDNEGLLTSHIEAMQATGNTYIAPGVMWGLRVLSEASPFTESADAGSNGGEHQKIMVLMSDGDNTKSPQISTTLKIPPEIATVAGFTELPDPYNEGSDRQVADKMTSEACEAVKDAKVTVYSISFGSDVSASGKEVLQGCGDEDKFFDFEPRGGDQLHVPEDRGRHHSRQADPIAVCRHGLQERARGGQSEPRQECRFGVGFQTGPRRRAFSVRQLVHGAVPGALVGPHRRSRAPWRKCSPVMWSALTSTTRSGCSGHGLALLARPPAPSARRAAGESFAADQRLDQLSHPAASGAPARGRHS